MRNFYSERENSGFQAEDESKSAERGRENHGLKAVRIYLALTVISLIAVLPLLKPGYFESHDGEWMVIRFSAFHQALASGQLPVRFLDRLNNNYGYPVANFLYPLPFYLAEVPKLVGFNFQNSIKLIFIFSTLASSAAMFWALSQQYSKTGSFIASVVYTFIPYRFVDLYVRGSLGECLSFTFLPLILGSIFKLERGKVQYSILLALSISGLITSHNIIAFIFIPAFLIVGLLLIKQKIQFIFNFALGIIIASFFWLPAIYDLKFVKMGNTQISNVSDHILSAGKLLIPSWGFGNTPYGENSFSPQLGIVAIVNLILSAYFIIKKKQKGFILFIFAISLLSILLMHKITLPLWQLTPLKTLIQFPWRFLSVTTFTAALLLAWILDINKSKIFIPFVFLVIAIGASLPYINFRKSVQRDDSFYSTNEATTTVMDEYMPIWVEEKQPKRADSKFMLQEGSVENLEIKSGYYRARITTNSPQTMTVNSVYFPGWEGETQLGRLNLQPQEKTGLITLDLLAGSNEVIIRYGRTTLHIFAELLSAVSLVVIIAFTYFKWKKQNS